MASAPVKQVDGKNKEPYYKRRDCDAMRCDEVLCVGVYCWGGFLKYQRRRRRWK